MDNKEIILAHERRFAARLASEVLNKPRLHAWMIFIPFIFIFYLQDLSKYKKQRREFIDNYLLSRRKALNEAEESIDEKRKPDTFALAAQAGLKEKATQKYGLLLSVLTEHYTRLLNARGDSYDRLVKSVYGTGRSNYLLFLNQLGTVEKSLNQALKSNLKKVQEGVGETIRKIEVRSDHLRRLETDEIYTS